MNKRNSEKKSVGENVVVLNISQGNNWLSGQVMERTGPLSYKITVGNKAFHRHIDKICKVHPQVHISTNSENIDKGSHLKDTCLPTITPPEVRVDLGTQESLVACRPEGSWVPMLNSAPKTEEAPLQGGNQQPTVQAPPVASGRPNFVPAVKSYSTRQRKQPMRYGYDYVEEVVVFCILMLKCVY